ncbi:MAG: heme ABC transporter ATP-binding protein [Actinomycetota bacterium]|nr:heme ABC transporter ATP-binding protein [Actinomycetota bacterium]
MTPLLEVRDLVVKRGPRTVISEVSLSVAAREVVVVIGPNGAGKSSLISAITGDLEPTAGCVCLGDTSILELTLREQARLRAVLTQQSAVAFGFTVREVVSMAREPWRNAVSQSDDARVISEALHSSDVTHLAVRPVQALSGGEQARVAIARTMAQTTPLLILDEPTAALDVKHQLMVMRGLRVHADAGGGALVVLHDLTLASQIADRIVILKDGTLVAVGAPSEVLTTETLACVYEADFLVHEIPGRALAVIPRMELR